MGSLRDFMDSEAACAEVPLLSPQKHLREKVGGTEERAGAGEGDGGELCIKKGGKGKSVHTAGRGRGRAGIREGGQGEGVHTGGREGEMRTRTRA
jgi:hypothetical protein